MRNLTNSVAVIYHTKLVRRTLLIQWKSSKDKLSSDACRYSPVDEPIWMTVECACEELYGLFDDDLQ